MFVFGCTSTPREANSQASSQKLEVSEPESNKTEEPKAKLSTTDAQDPSQLEKETIDQVKSACVLIGNFESGELVATGSGFITDNGKTVITNKHVVTGTDDEVDTIKVVLDPGMEGSKVLVIEPGDIAVIADIGRKSEKYQQIDVAGIRLPQPAKKWIPLEDDPDLAETKAVWCFGFPLGTEIMKSGKNLPTPTVHSMRIERVERLKQKVKVFQLSGSPTNGSSGGPVVSRDGTALGVLSAVQGAQQKIIYAVPLYAVRDVIAKANSQEMVAKSFDQPLKAFSEPVSGSGGSGKKVAVRRSDPGPTYSGTSALHGFYVNDDALATLSAQELTILRNEPFARRGYRFQRAVLRDHFLQYSWYRPRTSSTSAIERTFSKTERYNINYIRKFQTRYGLTW